MSKKFAFVISFCLIISVCCAFAPACSPKKSGEGSVFVFLSVRMKGGGDGTVCAVAQNEFALGRTILPVTLTLYTSGEYETDVSKMTEVESLSSDDLNLYRKLSVVVKVQTQSYFCARITYTAGGDIKFIQSETLLYSIDGNRIK